jgi:catechol-2,3-dioxygenase
VEGFADQLVSESVYLRTPDYIGFEVYADRPTGEWIREGVWWPWTHCRWT